MEVTPMIANAAQLLEVAGVVAIVMGIVVAAWRGAIDALRSRDFRRCYQQLRQDIGQAILLGLELLVGADIIRTVAESPTLQTVSVLGVIVLIRTFLSMTLERELRRSAPSGAFKGEA